MRVPQRLKELTGCVVQARDGETGTLADVYLDTEEWCVRYFVVAIGGPMSDRKALIDPPDIEGLDPDRTHLVVDLSRAEIETNPSAGSAELALPELHSSHRFYGFRIEGEDGEIGQVADLILDDEDWRLRYFEVDADVWWAGRRILIAPGLIGRFTAGEETIEVRLGRETIRTAPEYDPTQAFVEAEAILVLPDPRQAPARPGGRQRGP